MTIEKVGKKNMSIYLIPLLFFCCQNKSIIMREIAMETKTEERKTNGEK
jgi:hypothetical protein